ncbi:MAG: DUF4007 family protein [Chloroflexota bacterium]
MPEDISNLDNFRFSGHESFPCRYAWLPKVYRALTDNRSAFADTEQAMVILGVGKNMVQSIRFWIQVADIAIPEQGGSYRISDFGQSVLGNLDPYLEDIRTLWLIHWKISTHTEKPLFAWYYLLYHWHKDISKTEVLQTFRRVTNRLSRELSDTTLERHFDIFLHTYFPARSNKGVFQEDNLDCPLVELGLIQEIGERVVNNADKREAVYSFRYDEKPEISPALFAYCLHEFWEKYHNNEQTLSFRHIAFNPGSPGQVFKLPEWDIRQRLEAISGDSDGQFSYQESANIQRVIRTTLHQRDLLLAIYE